MCTAAAEPWIRNGVTLNLISTRRTCANGASVSPSFVDGSTYNPCTITDSECKATDATPAPPPPPPPHAHQPG